MSFPTYAEYKESRVKWLGSIPSHWEVVQSRRLFRARREAAKEDDVMLTASQKYGMIPQAEFVEKEGRRVVEVIQGKENLIHVEPDDFVISMRSFQGGLEWCRYTGSTSFHYVPVTPIKNVVPSFFAHLLKSAPYISALRSTTNLIRDGQEIRYSNFVQAPLPVVPKQEQLAIASFLDRETAKIDALIAEQQLLIGLLQEKRQAVISHAVTKGLNPNAPMKDSGVEWLGEVPEHWVVLPAGRICGIFAPQRDKPELNETEDGYPWITLDNINGGSLRAPSKWVSINAASESKARPLSAGSVIASCIGNFGITAVTEEESIINQQLQAYLPGSQVNPKFLHDIVALSRPYFESICTTSTLPYVNKMGFWGLPVPLPPEGEQEEILSSIGQRVIAIDTLIKLSMDACRLLQERRSALISAAVTGQVDVRGLATEEEP